MGGRKKRQKRRRVMILKKFRVLLSILEEIRFIVACFLFESYHGLNLDSVVAFSYGKVKESLKELKS